MCAIYNHGASIMTHNIISKKYMKLNWNKTKLKLKLKLKNIKTSTIYLTLSFDQYLKTQNLGMCWSFLREICESDII